MPFYKSLQIYKVSFNKLSFLIIFISFFWKHANIQQRYGFDIAEPQQLQRLLCYAREKFFLKISAICHQIAVYKLTANTLTLVTDIFRAALSYTISTLSVTFSCSCTHF